MSHSTEYFLYSYDLYPVDVALMPIYSIYADRHLTASKRMTSWKGYCLHRGLAVIEFIPIVGMIVSLFERYLAIKCRPDLFPHRTKFNAQNKFSVLKTLLHAINCRLMFLFKQHVLAKEEASLKEPQTGYIFNEKLPQDIINEILIKKIGNPQLSVVCKKWQQTYQKHFYPPLLDKFEKVQSPAILKSIYQEFELDLSKKRDNARCFIEALIQKQQQQIQNYLNTKDAVEASLVQTLLNDISFSFPHPFSIEAFSLRQEWLEKAEKLLNSNEEYHKLILKNFDQSKTEQNQDARNHKSLYYFMLGFSDGASGGLIRNLPRSWFGLKEASPFLTS